MSSMCSTKTKRRDNLRMMAPKIFISLMIGSCILLLPQNVLAWDGEDGYNGQYGQGYGYGGCGGYCAGQQDAAYDVQNNLQYQPQGSCLPCHSDDYWNNFKQGYDSYWNQHQEQSQGSSININGNNNYVSVNQYAQQNPLQQLAHLACGVLNCNQQQGSGINYGPPN